MPLRLASPDDTFPLPITLAVPALDGGTVEHHFTAEVSLIPDSELQRLVAMPPTDGGGDKGLLRAVLNGWDGIEDHTGAPLAFSEETRELLLDITYFTPQVAVQYVQWLSGVPEKNSAPLSAS